MSAIHFPGWNYAWNYGDLNWGFLCSGLVACCIFALAGIAYRRRVRKHRERHSELDGKCNEIQLQIARLHRKIEDLQENFPTSHRTGRRENQLIEDVSRILSPQ